MFFYILLIICYYLDSFFIRQLLSDSLQSYFLLQVHYYDWTFQGAVIWSRIDLFGGMRPSFQALPTPDVHILTVGSDSATLFPLLQSPLRFYPSCSAAGKPFLCRVRQQICQVLWVTQSLWNYSTQKQPKARCKWMGASVFQSPLFMDTEI